MIRGHCQLIGVDLCHPRHPRYLHLGFYIESAISDDQIDKAILLIPMTALLNMGIDSVSQQVRRRLKISTTLVTSS
jgi:hypothetical protein